MNTSNTLTRTSNISLCFSLAILHHEGALFIKVMLICKTITKNIIDDFNESKNVILPDETSDVESSFFMYNQLIDLTKENLFSMQYLLCQQYLWISNINKIIGVAGLYITKDYYLLYILRFG